MPGNFNFFSSPLFHRKNIVLKNTGKEETPGPALVESPADMPEEEFKVLVINSSQEMAKEITMQLNLKLPGCAISYAPSVELAKWILLRRPVDLVVSSPILPDGSIAKLQDVLEKCPKAPSLLVVGSAGSSKPEVLGISGYEFRAFRRIRCGADGPRINRRAGGEGIDLHIKNLGADLRNDLNNPLQEIVAMIYVAKAGGVSAPATAQALEAIEHAAQNMSKVVKGLENKIRAAVGG